MKWGEGPGNEAQDFNKKNNKKLPENIIELRLSILGSPRYGDTMLGSVQVAGHCTQKRYPHNDFHEMNQKFRLETDWRSSAKLHEGVHATMHSPQHYGPSYERQVAHGSIIMMYKFLHVLQV